MNPMLVEAISKRRRMRVIYNGSPRIVEPQCYGVGRPGRELLRVHQIRGGSEREPLLTVSKISGMALLDEAFERPGPNYQKNDKAMEIIYCQL
jgi:hypothetical protein